MIDFTTARTLLADRDEFDCACPECGPGCKSPANRVRKVLRLWPIADGIIGYHCCRCPVEQSGYVRDGHAPALTAEQRQAIARHRREAQRRAEAKAESKREFVRKLWGESRDSADSAWVESYLGGRGLRLPADTYWRKRTLRYHPACPFRDDPPGPALLGAFTTYPLTIPRDPYEDPEVEAIHRIRGRGHDNKAMLGPVAGKAVQYGSWETASRAVLSVCEGVEDMIALVAKGVFPIWAMGSAGAIASLPPLPYPSKLVVFADNDETGLNAARCAARRWAEAGTPARIRYRSSGDYADG
ncbi:toprim domain-containing protein [Rhizobium sp. BK399]|uniref:toprim domain-containing protein n=1 Tax=Rhizobium sp. BK399 TaxID=2587063 RepID=UPI00161DA14D|nr:toprim domain-containing protein [Rhizobium sp. BK399]MBB3540793.1 hypothetical protein [Rhizobium sp. BK399]